MPLKLARSRKFLVLALLFCLTLILSLNAVSAADNMTLYVNGGTGSDMSNGTELIYAKQTIQNAIDAAQDNGIVYVASGTYTENLKINKNLFLIGAGSSTTTINGDHKGSCIEIRPGVTVLISGFNIVEGSANNGGGINNYGTLTLQNSTVAANNANLGGGICNNGPAAVLYLKNSQVNWNRANDGSGIANHRGTLFLDDSIITDNVKALFHGTQVFSTGPVYANNTAIGGYIYYSDGTKSISGNYIFIGDVFGFINNQRGGAESSDIEDPDQAVVGAASTEKIASTHISNQKLIGMQGTGTPVNYLILAFLMFIGIFCLKKVQVNWN